MGQLSKRATEEREFALLALRRENAALAVARAYRWRLDEALNVIQSVIPDTQTLGLCKEALKARLLRADRDFQILADKRDAPAHVIDRIYRDPGGQLPDGP